MPKFFFDFDDSGLVSRDCDGQDFSDVELMRVEALKTLSRLIMECAPNGNRRTVIVDVRDAVGAVVFTASLTLMARWMRDQVAHDPRL